MKKVGYPFTGTICNQGSSGYWSAKNSSGHGNIFCYDPAAVREFMTARIEPWIAFKVPAAGAPEPADGFRYGYEAVD